MLVETGPDGFAPSTAYRVEQALRRAGINAAVEVVHSGGELTDYHRGALTAARRISLRQSSAPPRVPESVEPLFAESPSPRPVTSTRRRGSSAPAVPDKRLPGESASGRWQQRIAAAKSDETPVPEPTAGTAAPSMSSEPASALAAPTPTTSTPNPTAETSRPAMNPVPETSATTARTPTPHVAPSVSPSMSSTELSDQRPPAIADEETTATTAKPPATDAELSQREQELLRQLHEELAKREAPTQAPGSAPGAAVSELPSVAERPAWQVDRSGQRHSTFPAVDYGAGSWQPGQDQAVNGLPPYGGAPGGSTGR